MITAAIDLRVVEDPDEILKAGHVKPFLRLTQYQPPMGKGPVIVLDITLNQGEMIGGAAKGANQRFGFAR